MKFVNPKNDVAFRKIFGSEDKTDILIGFLNVVLNLEGDKAIQSVQILNPYQTPKLEKLKTTILDVRAKDKRGITFIVEMQIANTVSIPNHVDDPALQHAYESADRFGWSKEDLEAYEYRGMRIQDERGAITYAHQKGREEGERRKALETARNLLQIGLSLEQIAQATGLSVEEIKAIDE